MSKQVGNKKAHRWNAGFYKRIVAFLLVAAIAFNPSVSYLVHATEDTDQTVTTQDSMDDTITTFEVPADPEPTQEKVDANDDDAYDIDKDTVIVPETDNSLEDESQDEESDDLIEDLEESVSTSGSFKITMPTNETDATYTLTITLGRSVPDDLANLSQTENYLVDIDGEAHAVALVSYTSNTWGTLVGALTNIPSGATVTVKDVLVTTGDGTAWDDYTSTFVTLAVTSSDGVETAAGTEDLISEETVTFECGETFDLTQNTTTETFLDRADSSDDGEYSLLYMLNHYNVVSYKDIEATHIVGPIIAQESAYYTDNSSYLVASDYSRGVSSYVGAFSSYIDSTGQASSSFEINYGFDPTYYGYFTSELPNLYTGLADTSGMGVYISEKVEGWETFSYVYFSSSGETILSPNNDGRVEYTQYENGAFVTKDVHTYQNDAFIDFNEMWEELTEDSYALLENGYLEGDVGEVTVIRATDIDNGQLTIHAGGSYLIDKEVTQLELVNIILPDGYDFFVNPWLPPTIINIEGTSINPTTYNSHAVSQFPTVYINGAELTAEQGLNGEYSEIGNKLVWNMPNIVTTGQENRLVTYGTSPNIAGHIVAVNAEFWNIDSSGNWEGGNLNGAAIVKDFHSGVMEMHMWAYGGYTELSTYVNLEVDKTFTNGDLSENTFEFTLEPADEATQEALSTYTFPLKATTNDSGSAYFSALVFDNAGSYTFYVEEVIPEGDTTITYDATRYLVTIDVSKHTSVDSSSGMTTTTYSNEVSYQKVDADGTVIESASELAFVNTQDSVESTSYSFTKVNELGQSLSGAMFELTELDPAVDSTPWDTATTQITGSNGIVTFTELSTNSTYYFRESSAPSGYTLAEGYWMLEVDEYGVITVTAMDDAPNITNKELVNYAIEETLIEVTLYKQNERGSGLGSAVFQVQEVYGFDQHVVVEGGYSGTFASGDSGSLRITGLELGGVYKISEIHFPDGYVLPDDVNYWLLVVSSDETVELGYTITVYEVDLVDTSYQLKEIEDLVLLNADSYSLPDTGGLGTTYYTVIGLMLMIGAGFVLNQTYIFKRNRR